MKRSQSLPHFAISIVALFIVVTLFYRVWILTALITVVVVFSATLPHGEAGEWAG
jgi:hypothetical protein